jgi:hypothetical protein
VQPAYWPSGQEGGYELDWKELWPRKKERVMVSPFILQDLRWNQKEFEMNFKGGL